MDIGKNRASKGLTLFHRLLRDEHGQATVEYILLLSFIGAFSGFFGRRLLKTITDSILRFNGELERDIKTGRTPLRVWRN